MLAVFRTRASPVKGARSNPPRPKGLAGKAMNPWETLIGRSRSPADRQPSLPPTFRSRILPEDRRAWPPHHRHSWGRHARRVRDSTGAL